MRQTAMRQTATLVVFRVLSLVAGLLAMGIASTRASTSHDSQNLCDTAGSRAAKITGVPVPVLLAISRVETGRTIGGVLAPWPWAVNQAGSGSFFESKSDAVDHVSFALSNGETNIDVGCFQINMRWHGTEFASLEAMFDPAENALYAARFLLQLYQEFGSWDDAIGAYHSRQSGAATAYLAKVSALMDTTLQTPASVPLQTASGDNRYPLLMPGVAGAHGSLVTTLSDRAAVPLFR
ncbi:transglycosylase SLT domain-containing protein [Pseudotabrizicola sp. 4114]|uniref:transglycosylase SLT domain-containing protein n=1 Tax=Pseudotabrizicola sp. 4114 TaxID=2817731 RepID=UPI00285CCE55|nr:soluble lytic murein transglycosylase-like protein [Pseudorhodobacter sp. 4114]